MRTDGTVETLIRFGISDVCKALRKYDRRLTLSSIDNYLQKNPEKEKFPITLEWTCTIKNTVYWREWTNSVKLSVTIGRDGGGLYLSFETVSGDRKSWFDYYLTKRESNLKPGTYRYYFFDPFSVKVGDICSKLYYLPQINEFVPRSVLPSWGYLYRQQTKGKKDRLLYSYKKPPEGKDLKYRKSHYRGKITPFWSRYEYLCERENIRTLMLLFSWGETKDVFPSELGRDCAQYYKDYTGGRCRGLY